MRMEKNTEEGKKYWREMSTKQETAKLIASNILLSVL